MDLAGHKIRTGPLEEAPSWIRLRPRRAEAGAAAAPAQLALRPFSAQGAAMPGSEVGACLMLDPRGTELIRAGDRLEFTDLRGKRRALEVARALEDGGWLVHCHKNARMGPETDLRVLRMRAGRWLPVDAQPIRLSGYRTRPVKIRLVEGDTLRLTSPEWPGRAARRDASGQVVEPARIGITAAAVLERLQPGQPVWIDDGKAGAVVEEIDAGSALLRVTQAPPGGFRLRADKGINLPGAALELGPLSDKDMQDLDFVARHADLVGFSFVETAADMLVLMDELQRRGAGSMGIVAKIETERALRNLPEIMLSTIGKHPLAVMIARGDLAVEIGGERLAEIQEEILWLAEAGHVPVIWATQVLETLAKTGAISRPELSDAAMSGRAECVMLNKGPFIMSAVRTLDAILRRMQGHQLKKMPQLRALHLAHQG
jgi:pyruvate kinase